MVRRSSHPNGTQIFSFEDDADSDFNDVILKFDPTNCITFETTVLSVDSKVHHKVWLNIYWDGIPQDEILLFEDSHDAVNTTAIVNVANHEYFENFTVQNLSTTAIIQRMTKQ